MRPVVLLTLLVGCGRIAFDARDDGDAGVGDGATGDVTRPPCTAPFANVQEATWLNTQLLDWAPHESADGTTLYFGRDLSTSDVELFRSVRATRADAWGAPTPITELATAGVEEDNPAPSTDELEMYFGRNFVHRVSRTSKAQQWSGLSIAITNGVFTNPQGPFLSADSLTLYFTAISGATNYDVYRVTRPTRTASFVQADAAAMTAVNTPAEDGWPYVTDDELTIYFTSAIGGDLDIWMSTRTVKSDEFGTAIPVTVANTTMNEYDPHLSADGTVLWFASNRNGGANQYDIFFATRDCP